MKKFLANAMAISTLASLTCGLSACNLGTSVVEGIDATKTQLYIASYAGGNGYKWLDDVEVRFEEMYKDKSFEDGKQGVQVIIEHSKYITENTVAGAATNDYDLFFVNNVEYYEMAATGIIKDITDLLTSENPFDGKTIAGKFSDTANAMLEYNGKYYGLPNNGFIDGVSYDADLFNEQKLYFSNQLDTNDTTYPGTNKFVTARNATNLSCGPDAVYGTYDDGLPSSYQEFYKLMDRMVKGTSGKKIYPFAFTGVSTQYTNMLMSALARNYVGAKGWSTNFDFTSSGEKVEIVESFKNGKPVVKEVELTEDNAYLIKSSLGLYYASEFCQKVFSNEQYYDPVCASKSSTNLATQERFLKSGWDNASPTPIAMLIDGSYWFNEANMEGIVDRAKKFDPDGENKIKDVRYMPMPHQYEGTVTPQNEPIPQVLVDTSRSMAVMSAYTPKEHEEVAELFLQFCYSDAELERAELLNNGISRELNYDTSNIQSQLALYAVYLNQMTQQSKDCGAYRSCMTQHPIYMKDVYYWSTGSSRDYWVTQLDAAYGEVYTAFYATGCTAIQYFQGLAITEDEWKTTFLP